MKKINKILVFAIAVGTGTFVQAQEALKTDPQKPVVFNYEADIIEGEKKRPELFLQTNTNELSLDALVFLRRDFNDFHIVEKNRRPLYLGPGSLK